MREPGGQVRELAGHQGKITSEQEGKGRGVLREEENEGNKITLKG